HNRERSGAAATCELRGGRLPLVARLGQDRRHLGVGDEALPALLVPVEDHPGPVLLERVAEHERPLGTALLALLRALGREDLHEAVEVLHLCRCEQHLALLSCCVRPQAVRIGAPTRRSWGSIAPSSWTISNRPARASAMYMLIRRWCWPG